MRKPARPAIVMVVALALPVLAAGRPGPALADTDPMDAPMQVVRFGETDTIRDIVARYLGDPDLWPAVLALNDIASSADLLPGAELRLPVRQVAAADHALVTSLDAIQKANAEGARIFAPVQIGSALDHRDTAVLRRVEGEWRQVVSFAGRATAYANEALDISVAQRDRSAEAVVSDVQGAVEGRAPAEPRWSGRELNDILVEFERLRTLSASTAQVTFRDLSRLRLNANSNATIQRMRSDALTGGEVTKVSLAEGDFYALLNQLSEKTTFEIEVPGIETTTNSADFWIKNDASGARFVNYDEPGLMVSRDGRTETLGQGEGLVVSGRVTERAQVLDSPLPMTPEPGAVIHTGTAVLGWQAYEGAEAYWLEVATDPGFNHMQLSEWGIRATGFQAGGLPPAQYHWRVAALDRLGLPGNWSAPRDFILRQDAAPPFLTLLSPAPNTIVAQRRIEVLGASEADAAVVMNGQPLTLSRDGSFVSPMVLTPGENRIILRATDAAGNISSRERSVVYRPAAAVAIALSRTIPRVKGALATRSDELSVAGQTDAVPGAPVTVRDAAGGVAVQTRVAADGSVQFVVPVAPGERRYVIEVLAPGGAVEGRLEFGAVQDGDAPLVVLDQPPPRATSEAVLNLSGSAGDAVRLELDGNAVPLRDGRFDLALTLAPGPNGFDLVASDAVGNVALTRISTLLDIEPPQVLRTELSRPEGSGGPIRLQVQARDQSGLRQAAPFVIRIGDGERAGFLRCDGQTGTCSASLPPEPGTLAIVEIAIEDYAGNVAFE